MKNHRIPLTAVCKRLSRSNGERLLRTIAERNNIDLQLDWDAIRKWPSPEFLAAYKRLAPDTQGAFNAALVVIEDVGKASDCARWADLLLASMGKRCPPGLGFYDKVAWAYCELSEQEWEHLRCIAIAAANLRKNWTIRMLPDDAMPDMSSNNLLRLFSQARLLLKQRESRGSSGEIVSYALPGWRYITILTLEDRVVAKRQMADGKVVVRPDRPVFDILYYYDPASRALRVWCDSENEDGRQRLLELWSGVYANSTHLNQTPKNDYRLDVFRSRTSSVLEMHRGITGTVAEVVYGSEAGDRCSFSNRNLGVYDGVNGDLVHFAGGEVASVSVVVTGMLGDSPLTPRLVTFREHEMLGCDGEGEEQDAIRGYFRELGVCA
jgi:hypothetical protein